MASCRWFGSVPQRVDWILEKKLGAGGFGEVWMARHNETKQCRSFKFCQNNNLLRSFKRELQFFKIIRDRLGERKDIAQLWDVQLKKPPFFIETEYLELGNLPQWATAAGSLARIPLETRIDVVRRVARAVAASHSAGVLHKNIKPKNILMYLGEDGKPRPRLADFGIGKLIDLTNVDRIRMSISGLSDSHLFGNDTSSILSQIESSNTISRIFWPPEMISEKRYTKQGDVYALGVLLFQMVIGGLVSPLIGSGWEREVEDQLIRGAEEPKIEELKDGRILMVMRTQLGNVFKSYSADGARSWSNPQTTGLQSPESCPALLRIPHTGDLMLVWNDSPYASGGAGTARQ